MTIDEQAMINGGSGMDDERAATLEEMLEAVEQVKHRAEPENRPLTLEEMRAKYFRRPEQRAAEKWEE